MPIGDLSSDELNRMYGPWAGRTPADAARLFAGYPGLWWVAGGWAIEAFTGVKRHHGDLDTGVLRIDLPLLRRHLADRLRPSGTEPWEYDILLTISDHDTWEFKRDRRIRLPLADIVWSRDGVNYIRPEIQLLYKARGLRPKDQLDFEAALPRLDLHRRVWLRDALELTQPGHRWITAL